MLKIRVMPTLLYKGMGLVKGVGFDSWRRVGGVMQSIKVYVMREVDELVFLDIAATRQSARPDFTGIDEYADDCFVPLTVGGGIRSIADIRELLAMGADKVSINTAAVEDAAFVEAAASRFGAQCIVVSLDAREVAPGRHTVFTHAGTQPTDRDVVEVAKTMERAGAGELLVTSIERDGTMQGYDVELVHKVSQAVSIPVVASGGAGSYDHMADVIERGGASAVAAASIFHFTEQTPLDAKRYLRERGFAVRL